MGIIAPEVKGKEQPRPLVWLGSSKKDLMTLPSKVVQTFGYALYLAQTGKRHEHAKVLRGFGSADVLEVVESDRAGTYRAIYTVRFDPAVFVLHVFRKKSKAGRATPKPHLHLIEHRLKKAAQVSKDWSNE
jgi:phage-related protein